MVCVEGAIYDQELGECRCKRLTHYLIEIQGQIQCSICKEESLQLGGAASCSFCTFSQVGSEQPQKICHTEPIGFIASDDQTEANKFKLGPGCLTYMNQEIQFIIPKTNGWLEISQSGKVDQPLRVKFINKRPTTEEEKVDLVKYNFKFDEMIALKEGDFAAFWEYLEFPEYQDYEDPGFLACSQIDESFVLLTGLKTWQVEIEKASSKFEQRKNKNQDNNLYLHYFWRIKKQISGEIEYQPINLIWIGHEYKLMVVGSTEMSDLFLYSMYFEKIDKKGFFEYWSYLHQPAYNDFLQQYWADRDLNTEPIKISLSKNPRQITGLGRGQFMVLFENADTGVEREIISISPSKEVTRNVVGPQLAGVIKDMAADYIGESLTQEGLSILAVLSIIQNQLGEQKIYTLQILNTLDFTIKITVSVGGESWGSVSETDNVFLKLLPYSEYVAVAKRGEKNVLIRYYGNKILQDRTISTGFEKIVDLKVGLNEKLLYVFDESQDILAEYHAIEIGCLKSDGVTECN